MDVGFLGLGSMGSGMAARLVAAGHSVTVWNRSPGAADDLVAAGAVLAGSPADALARPVSLSMLANDQAAREVLSADNLAGGGPRIHLNMASISPTCVDELAGIAEAAGVAYVSAPVLGRPPVAAAGKLNILTAGPADAIAAVTPLLEQLSVRIWDWGTVPRRANVAKTAMNFMILHALESMGEAIALVEAHGVDAGDFVELFSGTLFGSVVHTGYGAMMAERRYTPPGFAMPLGMKDLTLAEGLAEEAGLTLPTTAVLRDRFERALADPALAEADWSAVAEVTRRH